MPGLLLPIVDFEPLSFSPGVKRKFGLGASVYNHGTTCVLPALLVRGTKPGPLLVATAGVHGDEYEGPRAIQRFYDGLDPAHLSGTFLGLPHVNPLAYQAARRKTPDWIDDLDLNRMWPGKAESDGGKPTQMLADMVWRVLAKADALADLHSGGTEYEFGDVTGFPDLKGAARAPSEALAALFDAKFLWRMPRTDGVLVWEFARRLGKPAIACECLGAGAFDPKAGERYLLGLQRTARHLNLVADGPPAPPASPTLDSFYQECPAVGTFLPSVRLGDAVKADQPLGTVFDEYGDVIESPKAVLDGIVIALRRRPRVTTDDWLCCLGV